MKTIKIRNFGIICMAFFMSSCNDYLNILPTGKKIPTSYNDFEAFVRDEYSVHYAAITQAVNILNDGFIAPANLSYDKLSDINYNWKEDADRNLYNTADEQTYYQCYESISTCNLLIEHVPTIKDGSDIQKNQLIATAKVLRAFNYFILTNYYADNYYVSTASNLKSVPLILSANVNASYKQVTIQEMYDFMINELTVALNDLPDAGLTILHPGKGAAHALLSRIYLQMENYPNALAEAKKALTFNDKLFDWNAYFNANYELITNPKNYTLKTSPINHAYTENYYMHQSNSPNFATSEQDLSVSRAAGFEDGDSKFASRWKIRTIVPNTFYTSTLTGYYNHQGLTTVEVYLIEAECLARNNQVNEAMQILNKVRKTRILPAKYQDLSASDMVGAVKLIQKTKRNELIFSIVPFADYRRLNKDAKFATTLSKTVDGKLINLKPTSHLWTMPFPLGAIKNPGNGLITQNVNK